LIKESNGIESGDGTQIYQYKYDSFDRLVKITNPAEGTKEYVYDANGNIVSEKITGGYWDKNSLNTQALLKYRSINYDELNRITSIYDYLFDSKVQDSLNETKYAYTLFAYNDNSQISQITDTNGHITSYNYDTVNRLSYVNDAKWVYSPSTIRANSIEYYYDKNSNITKIRELEISDINPAIYEGYTTEYSYDSLNRLVKIDDYGNLGSIYRTNYYRYDSLNNLTKYKDAKGNKTYYSYDGLSRLLSKEIEMTDSGDGLGNVTGSIINTQKWDDSSRLIAQTDGNGNTTRYAYDALNRLIVTRFADGTFEKNGTGSIVWNTGDDRPTNLSSFFNGYDVHDNILTMTDANGTVINNNYDGLNRLSDRNITSYQQNNSNEVANEYYSYDGISRLQAVYSVLQTPHIHDTFIYRDYDSLDNLVKEQMWIGNPDLAKSPDSTIINEYDNVGNRTSITYPNGRRIRYEYDELNRIKNIYENTIDSANLIASYYYIGTDHVKRRQYKNGIITDYGYDKVKRVDNIPHYPSSNPSAYIDNLWFGWDEMDNKISLSSSLTNFNKSFYYDSNYQLNSTVENGYDYIYDLDNNGNRTYELYGDQYPPIVLTEYFMDDTSPDPADYQMSQYTEVSGVDDFDSYLLYDKNGNLIYRYQYSFLINYDIQYNFKNEMVEYEVWKYSPYPPYPPYYFAKYEYVYDAFGRRVAKIDEETGEEKRFIYDGWRVIEEKNTDGSEAASYVYGNYIDEVLGMRRDVNNDGTPEDYYYHTDDLYNVTAITDSAGNVVERYDYDDFGYPHFYNPAGIGITESAIKNPYLFNGQRWDSETGFYYYRNRCYDPQIGRFISRDPLGIWGDTNNLGNPYTYVGNNPWSHTDPLGLVTPYNLSSVGPATLSKLGDTVFISGDIVTRDVVYRGFEGVLSQQSIYSQQQEKLKQNQETLAEMGKGVEIAATVALPTGPGDVIVGGLAIGGLKIAKAAKCLARAEVKLAKTSKQWKKLFEEAYGKRNVFVHHAIEQKVLKKYPGVIDEVDLYSARFLRGIPQKSNSKLHLSEIRKRWNQFYESHPTATKDQIYNQIREIDKEFGHLFDPPIINGEVRP